MIYDDNTKNTFVDLDFFPDKLKTMQLINFKKFCDKTVNNDKTPSQDSQYTATHGQQINMLFFLAISGTVKVQF